MNEEKRKSPSIMGNYTKKGELLIDSAKRLSDSSDIVNILANLIQYRRLVEKMYRENGMVNDGTK